jgi:hypothetical protein
MHMVYTSRNGRTQEGIVLAISKNRVRLAVPGEADAVELTLHYGEWSNEDGEIVEPGILLCDGMAGEICAETFPQALGMHA